MKKLLLENVKNGKHYELFKVYPNEYWVYVSNYDTMEIEKFKNLTEEEAYKMVRD